MQIIVPKKGTEPERRKAEAHVQIKQHYYGREIRDGSRFRTNGGFSKAQIRKVYG